MAAQDLKRVIGLGTVITMLIGYVVGASIFLLIGPIAGKVGPSVWVVYLMASIPAIFTSVISAQIASALPATGGTYVLASRTLGPFFGFINAWSMMVATMIGLPLIAYGFAEYLAVFFPGINLMLTALSITVFFGIVNIAGMKFAGWSQNAMVLIFLIGLMIFGIGGIFNADEKLIAPLMPNGFSPLLMAAIPAYFSFAGFGVILEIGGEIKNPRRNIPLGILISFLVVLLMYGIVTFSLTAIMPWNELTETKAAVAVAASKFLPQWVVWFISLGAIFAAWTTINAMLSTSPKELYALGRDKIIPEVFAKTGERSVTPYFSIIVVTLLGVAGISLGAGVVRYAFATVIAYMVVQILMAIGMLRLRKKLSAQFEKSEFKLKGFWFYFWPIGTIVFSVLYILLGIAEDPLSVGIFAALLLAGCAVYFERKWRLKKQNIDIESILTHDSVTNIE